MEIVTSSIMCMYLIYANTKISTGLRITGVALSANYFYIFLGIQPTLFSSFLLKVYDVTAGLSRISAAQIL
jgi:hypothetical protein